MSLRPLYHYTCDHGRLRIGDSGRLVPGGALTGRRDVPWPAQFVWLTDLAVPMREGLGLTSHILDCDRTAHRYRVTDLDAPYLHRWVTVARALSRDLRDEVEAAPGAMPMHWWVSREPVPVVYDPLERAA